MCLLSFARLMWLPGAWGHPSSVNNHGTKYSATPRGTWFSSEKPENVIRWRRDDGGAGERAWELSLPAPQVYPQAVIDALLKWWMPFQVKCL